MTRLPPNYQQPQPQQPKGIIDRVPPNRGYRPSSGGIGGPGGQAVWANQPQAAYRGLEGTVNGQTQQFVDQRQNLRNLINQYSDPMSTYGRGGWMGAALGRMGGFERSPLPNDQYANQYAQHIMGGQQQSVMDLAKNLRQSNVRGMRVAGGADPYSQSVKDAYGTLASGYADRYKQSMDYAKGRVADDNAQRQFLANLGLQNQQNSSSALNNMLNLQYQYAMADEDRRRNDLNWQDYMSERGRRWKTEDVDRQYELRQRSLQDSLNERNRQLYNQYASHGPNQAQQLLNYFYGPGQKGLPSYMTSA